MTGHIVVTGAASGIGAAVADRAEADGWTVARLDREYDGLDVAGGRYHVDVAEFDSAATTVDVITSHWGRAPDAVVHAAGIYRVRPATSVAERDWDESLTVNARGSFVVARAIADSMIQAGTGGSVVLLGSVAALRGDAVEPSAAYSASKGAVSALIRQLAVEWGRSGIRVNGVMPGVIDTAMTTLLQNAEATADFLAALPMGRLGRADEVAAACMFLAGSQSSYVTGIEMAVDGGYLVS
ncbi:SDR family NAD(P)-dependent oxidoreductase [Mycolicibacterium sediminis]|uniref:3-oxoacyl-ACP reductase n=1 Tax=Mycolicibacterium sediminis TaxID=1286180 RepID=A0A7I7QQ36_9MYCO|nr:SDR family NAD(P)-dependent oxidoreductase [Mycolicibacterium sediminis]BBY28488.1 3-oxoacyl-ACP reductase [Mycolicibacterium sediminis]